MITIVVQVLLVIAMLFLAEAFLICAGWMALSVWNEYVDERERRRRGGYVDYTRRRTGP